MDHFTIPVPGLSSELAHLTLVQLSDIHVGPFMPPEELAEYVEAVNRLKPDIIALTGDFVAGSESEGIPVLSLSRDCKRVTVCLPVWGITMSTPAWRISSNTFVCRERD